MMLPWWTQQVVNASNWLHGAEGAGPTAMNPVTVLVAAAITATLLESRLAT